MGDCIWYVPLLGQTSNTRMGWQLDHQEANRLALQWMGWHIYLNKN